MRDAKTEGASGLPEWIAESKEIRNILKKTEQGNYQSSNEFLNSQRKFTHLMKVNPKQADRLDFRYAVSWFFQPHLPN